MRSILTIALAIGATLLSAQTPPAFSCNLKALTPEARKRLSATVGPALQSAHKQIRELPNGFEFQFPSDAATARMVSEFAADEHLCCAFFDIEMRFDHDQPGLWLRLTGREGVKQFIQSDFAKWFQP